MPAERSWERREPGRARPALTLPAPPALGLEGLPGSAAAPEPGAQELSRACWFVADLIHTNWIRPQC